MKGQEKEEVELDHRAILEFLFEHHRAATSQKKLMVGIRKIQSGLKDKLEKSKIIHGVSYLESAGYIDKSFDIYKTPKGLDKPTNQKYKISALGIKIFENPGIFTPNNKFIGGINIQNVKSIVVVGNRAPIVINQKFEELGKDLEQLKEKIQDVGDIANDIKLQLISLVNSLEGICISEKPDKKIFSEIVEQLKKKIDSLSESAAGNLLAQSFVEKVYPYLKEILDQI